MKFDFPLGHVGSFLVTAAIESALNASYAARVSSETLSVAGPVGEMTPSYLDKAGRIHQQPYSPFKKGEKPQKKKRTYY